MSLLSTPNTLLWTLGMVTHTRLDTLSHLSFLPGMKSRTFIQ